MVEKRKAATNLFMEQQQQMMEMEEEELCEEPEPLEDSFYEGETAAPPMEPQVQSPHELSQTEIDGLLSNVAGGGIAPNAPAPAPQKIYAQERRARSKKKPRKVQLSNIKTSEELQLEKEPIKVRITGSWFWKRVIVPPNAYVVHTRIHKKEPVTLGLGISFRYNPYTDAYLIVPAAMQTIGVVANCITKEKQGINILAYVQWQIDDFAIAYKKLDFSNASDPLGIVNAQLREQAEAAIKDKIATMSVEDVLTDKAPIIEELTSRLKLVAEGQEHGDQVIREGLGISITTVQIREAFVSSTTLWTDLQSPFRHEQRKKSSISYLEMQNEIQKKELETTKLKQTREAETYLEIERIKQQKQTEALELKYKEETTRYQTEQESKTNKLKLQEETLTFEKISKDRLIAKDNEIKLKRELEILQQQEQKAAEEVKVKLESAKRIAESEKEKKLFDIAVEENLNNAEVELEKTKLEQQILLRTKEAELQMLEQRNNDELAGTTQQAKLERDTANEKARLAIEDQRKALECKYQSELANIEKMRQEAKNIMNNSQLFSQLIHELPKIAEQMPEIKELKILQTGDGENTVDSLVAFLGKIFSVAKTMGIKLPFTERIDE